MHPSTQLKESPVAAALTAKPRLPAPVVAVVSGGNIGMDQIDELRKLAH